MAKIGEFELLVLLAILRQADEPYANRVRKDLEEHGVVEQMPQMEGRQMIMVMSPRKK